MADCKCHIEVQDAAELKTLRRLLLINSVMFAVGIGAGVLAHSTALVADSMDMFADASVYTISLYAVGKSANYKQRAAYLSGIFQITLAMLIIFDTLRRSTWQELPEPNWMIGIAVLSMIANSYCLYLIAKHRRGEVHMRASWIFTQNDVIANISVIIAGVLVKVFNSQFPDLIVGFGISVVVAWGGIRIIRAAKAQKNI